MKIVRSICLLNLILVLCAGPARAEGKWGISILANYEFPVFTLNQWFPSGGAELGGALIRTVNDKWAVEVEGSWSKYSDGDLNTREFLWSVDGQTYSSPSAQSEMEWTTGVVNWVRSFNAEGVGPGKGGKAAYMMLGTGFFRYTNKISGLIFPGQSRTPLDTSVLLRPVNDKRTSLGLNLGLGYQFFTGSSVALDVRGQYSVVMGHVRPLEAWGLQEAFPFQKFDLGARLKFYFAN
jgi:opacity protein-like surface antigen